MPSYPPTTSGHIFIRNYLKAAKANGEINSLEDGQAKMREAWAMYKQGSSNPLSVYEHFPRRGRESSQRDMEQKLNRAEDVYKRAVKKYGVGHPVTSQAAREYDRVMHRMSGYSNPADGMRVVTCRSCGTNVQVPDGITEAVCGSCAMPLSNPKQPIGYYKDKPETVPVLVKGYMRRLPMRPVKSLETPYKRIPKGTADKLAGLIERYNEAELKTEIKHGGGPVAKRMKSNPDVLGWTGSYPGVQRANPDVLGWTGSYPGVQRANPDSSTQFRYDDYSRDPRWNGTLSYYPGGKAYSYNEVRTIGPTGPAFMNPQRGIVSALVAGLVLAAVAVASRFANGKRP